MAITPRNDKAKAKNYLIAGVLLVLLAAAVMAWTFLGPKGTAGSKTITVNIDHLGIEDNSVTIQTDAEFLRQALEEKGLIEGEEGEYGLYIKSMDGESADDGKQQWWGYSVNGETAQYGVDSQPIADGDVFDFTLNVGW